MLAIFTVEGIINRKILRLLQITPHTNRIELFVKDKDIRKSQKVTVMIIRNNKYL